MYPYYGSGVFSWLGMLMMIVWWVIIIAVVAAVARWLLREFKSGGAGNRPLDILKERFAKGEITEKQFEEMKKKLG
ncbi:MAG: hypothetical protein HW383_137 [Candidatus Magasanikbacteria bacterium]|nr:hypothetical protein [Candidatus Magasanikbacteria bacterium]